MKKIALAFFPFLIGFVLYPIWLPFIGKFLVVSDPLRKADALVILAGDENERIAAGAQLFHQGYAEWFVVTDMHLDIPNSEGIYGVNVKRKAVKQGIPEKRILIVPGQVSTTDQEVIRIRDFSNSLGFHSLIVVTSPFHTRRARWLLRETFRGSDMTLTVRPALNYNYQAETWWKNPLGRQLTELEYAKLLAHFIGCREYPDCGPLPWALMNTWQKNLEHK